MQKLAKLFALAAVLALSLLHEHSFGQRIIYSDPEKDDNRRLNFEIIGRVGGNFLVFKNNRARSWISVMDEEMQVTNKEELGYLPNPDKTINVDFFAYPEHSWMIFQYERKNVVYCVAAKLDKLGKRMGELIELDTTHIGFTSDNRLYAVAGSEDKRKIALVKINTRDRGLYRMSTLLFNEQMDLIKKYEHFIPMEDRNVQLGDIELDNEGSLVMTRFQRTFNDNISNAALLYLKPGVDTLVSYPLSIDGNWLDNLRLKIDNYNKRYILTSLFSRERRAGIDGCYFLIYHKPTASPQVEQLYTFSDQLRQEAKGNATTKTAFNDYFIRHLISRRDGGLLIGSESYYTTSRANTWNRWDYLYGSPFWGMNNFYVSPYSNRMWWGSVPRNQQAVRFHADNVLLQSFSPSGQLEWSQVISKSQFDDETDDLLSFQLMNTGGELHVLYNQQERRDKLLSDIVIRADGQAARNPALKNLDNGHQFMPARGKQVSSRIMIIPTVYRGYICFAKVEYN